MTFILYVLYSDVNKINLQIMKIFKPLVYWIKRSGK